MNTKIKIGLLLIVVAIATSAALTMIHSQSSQNSNSQKQQKIYGDVPVVDYTESLTSDLQEQTKRLKRGKSYNLPLKNPVDIERFKIIEKADSSYTSGFPTHAPAEPAIPAASSTAIIIGEVAAAKAFLSSDETDVYSEFVVDVSEVFKNTASELLIPGAKIAVLRGGGAVRFPSGKVIQRLATTKPMPRVGQKYMFFLKYNKEGEDYPLITAYEIRDGQIIPLDGKDVVNGQVVKQLAAHQSYQGTLEEEFLTQVKAAINAKADVFDKRRGK